MDKFVDNFVLFNVSKFIDDYLRLNLINMKDFAQ